MKHAWELQDTAENEVRYRKLAHDYAKFRPVYPDQFIEYLTSVTPRHLIAWDQGTGNGQVAHKLGRHFSQVFAADVSFEQLTYAGKSTNICYLLARAEQLPAPTGQVDIVTVAQALHWFNLDLFYSEVKRILKPGGIIAVWVYHVPQVDTELNQIMTEYYRDVLGPFWSPSIRLVEDKYTTIPFPFEELFHPCFEMTASWQLQQFEGFLASWSAVPRFVEAKGYHPLLAVQSALTLLWGNEEHERLMRWPIYLRMGRVPESTSIFVGGKSL